MARRVGANKTSVGAGLECSSCGGKFPLATLSAGSRCPFCGAAQAMDATAILAAQRYREEVNRIRGPRARRSSQLKASRTRKRFGVVSILVGALGTALGFGLLASGLSDSFPIGPLVFIAIYGFGGFFFLGFVLLLLDLSERSRGRTAEPAPEPAPMKVRCPHCGGANHLALGQHVGTCQYCDGALMPSETMMGKALDSLVDPRRERQRRAPEPNPRARWRASMATLYGSRGLSDRVVAWLLAALIAPPLVSVPWAFAKEAGSILGSILCTALVLAITASAIALALRARRARGVAKREQLEQLEQLAQRLHGHARDQIYSVVDWMNQHWYGPDEVDVYYRRERLGAVACETSGFACLIMVGMNPQRSGFDRFLALSAQRRRISERGALATLDIASLPEEQRAAINAPPAWLRPSYLRVFLAAELDEELLQRAPWQTGPAQAIVGWLREAGFAVKFGEGGLIAKANPQVVRHLEADIRGVRQLLPVIAQLGALAQEIRAVPVRSLLPTSHRASES